MTSNNKEDLKRLVIEAISNQCKSTAAASDSVSSPPDIIAVASALNDGHQLQLKILTGGLANYSYKAFFPDSPETPALFAKLTFTYALVFPDMPCPINRTQFEYAAMEIYQKVVSSSPKASHVAVTPYFCMDIGDDKNKLLVAQFSPLEEQAANQFIDGTVDMRVATKLAHSLAALHSVKEVDPNFNAAMKPFFQDLTSITTGIFGSFFSDEINEMEEEDMDRPTRLARLFGKATLDKISTQYCQDIEETDCIIHGDSHVFNMLVGAKPSIETLEHFSESGDVVLIDWEFSHIGPIGKDLGFFHPFPIAACLAHALNGELLSSENILNFLDTVWDEYAASVSTERELSDIYKSMLAFCGVITVTYYNFGFHMEYLPIDEGNVEGLNRVKESLGVLGLKFMSWGFGRSEVDVTLPEIRQKFKDAVAEEMQLLFPVKKAVRRGRRSSMLRASGRRVSDAHLYGSMKDRKSLIQAEALMKEAAEED
jgi:aminoglycoside phosphotransferase (APT) family kinase protein